MYSTMQYRKAVCHCVYDSDSAKKIKDKFVKLFDVLCIICIASFFAKLELQFKNSFLGQDGYKKKYVFPADSNKIVSETKIKPQI